MSDTAVDVLIVGGGPAGLYAAARLARAGFHVVVCEEHRTVGDRVVLLACGAHYALQRSFGLGLPKRYLHTAQRELPASAMCDLELHFGREIAPDGFAWAVPILRPDGAYVRIGAMASHDAAGCY